jgi:lipopolysaccharide transport system permease protein
VGTFASVEELPRQQCAGKGIRAELRALYRYRNLIRYLSSTELRGQNAGTVFGFLWWLLDPLLLTCVYFLLVIVFFKRNIPAYPVFIGTTLISWTFFTKGVRNSLTETLSAATALRAVAFPRSAVPLSVVVSEFAHFVFGMLVIVAMAMIGYGINPAPIDLSVVLIAIPQIMLSLGLAFLLIPVFFAFRDLERILTYVFRMWYYASPGLYTVAMIPDHLRAYYKFNPFSVLFPAYRSVLLHHQWPPFTSLAAVTGFSFALMFVGFIVFTSRQSQLVRMAM